MNCFLHPDKPSVAKCRVCGKDMCEDCNRDFGNGICPSCHVNDKVRMLQSVKNSLIADCIALGLFLIGLTLYIIKVATENLVIQITIIVGVIIFVIGYFIISLFSSNLKQYLKINNDIKVINNANKDNGKTLADSTIPQIDPEAYNEKIVKPVLEKENKKKETK